MDGFELLMEGEGGLWFGCLGRGMFIAAGVPREKTI